MEEACTLPIPSAPSREVPLSADLRLRAIVREHYDFLWRSLRRLGVPEAGVDDAAQIVLVVLARRLNDVRSGSERAFLFGTAMRTASDLRKKNARRREVGDDAAFESELSAAPGADELVDQRRARELLDHVLDEMPSELRTVFVLAELEGMTMAETASFLEIPNGTVASRLRRSRAWFEEQVECMQTGLGRRA